MKPHLLLLVTLLLSLSSAKGQWNWDPAVNTPLPLIDNIRFTTHLKGDSIQFRWKSISGEQPFRSQSISKDGFLGPFNSTQVIDPQLSFRQEGIAGSWAYYTGVDLGTNTLFLTKADLDGNVIDTASHIDLISSGDWTTENFYGATFNMSSNRLLLAFRLDSANLQKEVILSFKQDLTFADSVHFNHRIAGESDVRFGFGFGNSMGPITLVGGSGKYNDINLIESYFLHTGTLSFVRPGFNNFAFSTGSVVQSFRRSNGRLIIQEQHSIFSPDSSFFTMKAYNETDIISFWPTFESQLAYSLPANNFAQDFFLHTNQEDHFYSLNSGVRVYSATGTLIHQQALANTLPFFSLYTGKLNTPECQEELHIQSAPWENLLYTAEYDPVLRGAYNFDTVHVDPSGTPTALGNIPFWYQGAPHILIYFNDASGNLLGRVVDCHGNFITVEDQKMKDRVHLYPNPTQSELRLRNDNKIASWTITNSQGQILHKGTQAGPIDVEWLAEGTYVLHWISMDGASGAEKFVKH